MKKVCNLFAAATLLVAGATSASARHWGADVNAGAVASIVAGQTYVLQPAFAEAANGNCFLAGQKFTTTTSLTLDNVFVFEAAGNNTFYLKRHGLNENQYLADPSNQNFYTSATDRAWKFEVKQITETRDPEHSYEWTHAKADGTDTTETIKGLRAYVEEAKASNSALDLSTFTFVQADNAIVLVSTESKKKDDPYSEYNFLLTCPKTSLNGDAGKGTDYNRNAWLVYAVNQLSAKEDLQAVIAESLGANFNVDEFSEKFPRGNNIGEYNQAKYDAFMALYTKAQEILNGGASASDGEIDQLVVDLPKAYTTFTTSGKVLEPGYYILTSYRSQGTGYDDGALYDGGAVNDKDKQLHWTYKGGDITYKKDAALDYKSLKYIWKVTKNDAKPGYFFFQNLATNRYVGTAQNIASNGNIVPSARIEMTDGAEASYNIVTSRNYPGYFCFYSPDLWRGKGKYWGYDGGDRWDFGGVHTGSDHNGTVVWDWQADGSTFKARTITEQEVQDLLKSAEQDINNEKAQKLIAEAQAAYDKGFAYMGVDASGKRLEESTSGALTNNGLITNGENLSSPMADKEEGVGEQHSPAVLLDGNPETYFHTSWHGGDDAWKGNHFLQFKLDNPESELLLKWVKRNHGNANGGAPEKITIWGAKTDAALEAGKAEKVDQDGNVVTDENGNNVVDFDAWKKNKGWDSLVVSTFSYPYTVTWQDNNGADVKKTNFAGTSYFKLPADKGAYKYFRMEVTKTVGNGEASGNKFFYGSEFRVYKGAYDGQNSLIDAVPQADRTALTTAIATLKGELNTQKATKASIEALRAAYDQFLKNYPDPSRVTKAIAAAKALEAAAEENGNEVGYYAAGSKATYKAAIETVENNLKAITATKQPTVAQVNDLLAQLDAANKAFAEKLNVPADGIYRIVSKSSEASIAGNSVVANTPSTQNYLKLDGRMKEGSTYKDVPDFETRLGAYWKLTKVAGGYTYQNLYTGLYLAPKEEKGTRVMSLRKAPYTLDLRYAKTPGCFNLVADTADVQGKEHIYVNAEPGSKNLVLWNEANGKDNSAFSFTEAKAQLEDALQAEFSLPIKKGVAQIITLPIAADPGANNFYTVIGQDANNRIQLKKHEGTLEAGQAYVLIPEAGDDESVILLSSKAQTIATLAPVSTPATPVNGLVPVFETTKVNKDSGVFNADHSKVLLSEVGESVAAGSGYFTKMPMTTETGDKYLETNGTITTVGRVVANGQLVNAVYTLSGVRVKDTKHLPAGLYIVNGKKVVVK